MQFVALTYNSRHLRLKEIWTYRNTGRIQIRSGKQFKISDWKIFYFEPLVFSEYLLPSECLQIAVMLCKLGFRGQHGWCRNILLTEHITREGGPGSGPGFVGGGQLLRPQFVDVAKQSYASMVNQGSLKGPGSFWVFNAQICILSHSKDSFLTSSFMPKADKNSTLHCTSINLRYVYVITPFANLHFLIFMKKLCIWLFDLRRNAKQHEARKFYDISVEK